MLGVVMSFYSCDDIFELDLLEDPNNPTPETADLESLYNSVQLEFEDFLRAPQFFTMQLSRQIAFTAGNVYETAFSPINFDNTWVQAYSGFLPDAAAVIELASPTQQFVHVGSTQIMQAYVMTSLVDLFVNVPFDEAGLGIDVLSPQSQDGQEVYAAATELLNTAIANLEANTADGPDSDIMYNGSADSWIAAANSLLLRIAVANRDQAAFNAIIDAGNFITDEAGDFQFEYGPNRANPDSRHPLYADHYEAADGAYLGNWYMWAMSEDKDVIDPRARAYFYRQVAEVPLDNLNRFDCIFSVLPDPAATPDHYLACNREMPYCVGSLNQGYYGRCLLYTSPSPRDRG